MDSGCHASLYLPPGLLEEWIREDIPFVDLTTTVLGIGGAPGRARLVTRERVVACGLVEAAAVYRTLGARVELVHREGLWVEPGTVLLEAHGEASALHAAWRVAQSLAAIGSAVATYTRLMVERARKVNPRVVVAAARKAPPGLRHLYYHCVLCGGASLHRMGVSDTVIVFQNHYRFLGGLDGALERLREARSLIGERRIIVEVGDVEEAVKAARSGVVDEVQVDHLPPRRLAELVRRVRGINPSVRVAASGGISLENVEEYAATGADFLVTSAPYWVKPADLTTVIEPLEGR